MRHILLFVILCRIAQDFLKIIHGVIASLQILIKICLN